MGTQGGRGARSYVCVWVSGSIFTCMRDHISASAIDWLDFVSEFP